MFIKKIISDGQDYLEKIIEFLLSWSYNDPHISSRVLEWVLDGIHGSEFHNVKKWFIVLGPLLLLEDNLQEARINRAMERLLNTIEAYRKFPRYTKECIDNFRWLAHENALVAEWLEEQRERWIWMEEWLQRKGFTPDFSIGSSSGSGGWKVGSYNQPHPSGYPSD
jgi:hypothetical protein